MPRAELLMILAIGMLLFLPVLTMDQVILGSMGALSQWLPYPSLLAEYFIQCLLSFKLVVCSILILSGYLCYEMCSGQLIT